jgi:ADP-heptose:LPS heptosyltransferase
MHLAAVIGTPSITIMSGVFRDQIWDPFGEKSIVLRHPIECSNCLNEFSCPRGTSECVSKISVDQVKDSFKKVVANYSVGKRV